jgi:hypothetical protein
MGLDCRTPRGKEFIKKQEKVSDIIAKEWGVETIGFGEDDSPTDKLLVKEGVLKAVVEIKVRESAGKHKFDWKYLERQGSYLVTHDKILKGIELSKLLRVPFFLIVDMVHEDFLVYWKITDKKGDKKVDYTARKTKTQTTCNGGTANRENAYISLKKAKKIKKN